MLSHRARSDPYPGLTNRPGHWHAYRTQSYRPLRDGILFERIPGNKLPGYDHPVPPGQRLSTPVHIFEATSLRVTGFEDEAPCEDHPHSLLASHRRRAMNQTGLFQGVLADNQVLSTFRTNVDI